MALGLIIKCVVVGLACILYSWCSCYT